MTVRVVPEGGTVLRLRWLRNGIIDMFSEVISVTRHLECYRPEQRVPDGGPFQLRVLFGTSTSAWGLAVRRDSPLKTIHDIGPDTRVAMFPPPSDMTFGVLNWLGLNDGPVLEDPKQGKWNVKLVPYSNAVAWFRSVSEGRADVVFGSPNAPPLIEQAAGQHGLRFLELPYDEEPEGAQKFLDCFPVGSFGPAPEVGVKEIWGVKTLITYGSLFARADMDEELAYNITKWFVDNHDRYKEKHPMLLQYNLDTFRKVLDMTPCPVHPGTIRYLKEKGLWTAKDDTLQEYNIRLLEAYIKAWDVAQDRAAKQEIKVAADSAEFAALWTAVKKEMGIPGYRTLTEEQVKERLALMDKLGL